MERLEERKERTERMDWNILLILAFRMSWAVNVGRHAAISARPDSKRLQ
jgi:hypothetical protein